jgi:hypothetical protein
MDKFLAIVVLLAFVWLAIPRLISEQWIAPTPVAPNSWATAPSAYVSSFGAEEAQAAATPPEGFGWFHFDFWNHPTLEAQPASTADLKFRSPGQEFRK